jgi:hypothetical protein
LIKCLHNASFVRGQECLLEVAGSREVVVERALADIEASAKSINAQFIWAVIRK